MEYANRQKRFLVRPGSPLGWRFMLCVILLSSVLSLTISAVELYWQFDRESSDIALFHKELGKASSLSLSSSLWNLDLKSSQLFADGLVQMTKVDYIVIRAIDKPVQTAGVLPQGDMISSDMELTIDYFGQLRPLGTFTIQTSLASLYQSLYQQSFRLLFFNLLKTLAVGVFAAVLFQRMISVHLGDLQNYLHRFSRVRRYRPLTFQRSKVASDELDELQGVVNLVCRELDLKYQQLEGERKQLEVRVRQRTEVLTMAHRLIANRDQVMVISQLSGSLAHELRNPLGVVQNTALLLRESIKKGEAMTPEKFDRLFRGVDRCTDLLDQLRDLGGGRTASPEQKQFALCSERLQQWVLEILEERQKARFTLSQVPRVVLGLDEAALVFVLKALLDNAVKAIDSVSEQQVELPIHIQSFQSEGQWVLKVCDSGCGFEGAEDELFALLSSSHVYSMGMGLSVARSLIQDAGGRLRVYREKEQTVAELVFSIELVQW